MPSHASHPLPSAPPCAIATGGRLPRWGPAICGLLLAALTVFSLTASARAQADPRRNFGGWSAARTSWPWSTPQTPHPSVVRVIVPERNGMSLGSGTLVDVRGDYGLVLTNWHVVSDAAGVITVVFPDGFRTAAHLVKTDRTWDLAALAVWKPNAKPVPLAADAPRPGEPLTIAGYGSGEYRAASARCTQYVAPGMNQPFEMVEVGTAARQGDSGGPIFNSRGELAGVLFGAGFGTTSGSYCGRVREFLQSVLPADSTAGSATIAAGAGEQATRLSAVVPRDPAASAQTPLHGGSGRPGQPAASGSTDSSVQRQIAQEAETGEGATTSGPFGQIKTFLAVVGGAAFLLHALKIFRPRQKMDGDSNK